MLDLFFYVSYKVLSLLLHFKPIIVSVEVDKIQTPSLLFKWFCYLLFKVCLLKFPFCPPYCLDSLLCFQFTLEFQCSIHVKVYKTGKVIALYLVLCSRCLFHIYVNDILPLFPPRKCLLVKWFIGPLLNIIYKFPVVFV